MSIYNSDKYNHLDGRLKLGSTAEIARANTAEIQTVCHRGRLLADQSGWRRITSMTFSPNNRGCVHNACARR
jgi:hypothetical protein